ncbi:MAG: permease [Spirochaetia bacterium]|nr:permease [Spirochaetia bacterium]
MNKKIKQWVPVIALALISAVLLYLQPEARTPFGTTVLDYTMELIVVLPAVLLLMGLLSLFISNQFISAHLGSESGLKGMAVAFLLGTLPTGPVYMAFPIARTLRDKGARVANIYIFLSAWACIKIPQELVELRFLGAEFMIYRLVFTVIMVSLLSLFVEKFAHKP